MKRIEDLAKDVKEELLKNITPFWLSLKDDENGGFIGVVKYDLEREPHADKGVILMSRIAWFFSSFYVAVKDGLITEEDMSQYGYGKEDIKKAAESAYLFIKEKCIDKEFGGVFWSVTYDGLPADTTKHTYNQAFAIYAMSEYYRAFGDKEALSIAKELLSIIEGKMRDEGGYLEAFTRDFKPASNEKLSENGVMATRTMNTLLHVMEGYSGLYRSSKDSEAGDRLREIYSIFKSHMYDEERDRQLVFFDHEYNSLIDLYSYGHDIETSWLMDMSADILGDSEWIPYIRRVTYEMAEAIYSEAFDGISLPSEAENGVVREIRVWWVQAETINGFLNAFLRDQSEEKFLTAAEKQWGYIKEHQIDHRSGEWFADTNKDGSPVEGGDIVNGWKCPYHNGRMCLLVMRWAKERV